MSISATMRARPTFRASSTPPTNCDMGAVELDDDPFWDSFGG